MRKRERKRGRGSGANSHLWPEKESKNGNKCKEKTKKWESLTVIYPPNKISLYYFFNITNIYYTIEIKFSVVICLFINIVHVKNQHFSFTTMLKILFFF